MNSYVVIWQDLRGRVRFKGYVYRACAEKFAVSVARNSFHIGRVRIEYFNGFARTSSKISRVDNFLSRVSDGAVI